MSEPIVPPPPIVDPLLSNPVDEKSYSRPAGINLTQEEMQFGFKEPTYQPGSNASKNTVQEPFSEREQQQKREPKKPLMPDVAELSDDEKEDAAEHLAESIMDGYEWLHGIGNNMIVVSDRKLRKLVEKGLDVETPIPWTLDGRPVYVPWIEFMHEYNETAKDTLKVEPKFRKKVMPPLIRVLKKRGAGMTDEAYLAIQFGGDISMKVGMVLQMKRQVNDSIKMAYDMMDAYKSGMKKPKPGSVPQQDFTSPPPPQGPPPAAQTPQEPPTPVTPVVPMYQHHEPGEISVIQDDPDIAMHIPSNQSSFINMEKDPAMPQFGNQVILGKLDDVVGKEEKLTRRRDRNALRQQRQQNKKDKADGVPGPRRTRKRKNKLGK